jgi:lipopolysaccharide/colanic/teichoic acid biosynthesis glycosyltransferase
VVSVAQTPGWSSQRLHHLAWDLEGTGAELVVDPGLMEIAGPRLHVAAVDGLPLLRLTEPAFTGMPRVIKAVSDRLVAGLLLVLTAPVMMALAIAVRSDGGPVFYRQSRVGQHGKLFSMIKFRSMVVNADQRRFELADSNQGSGPLFKLRQDPRLTRIGAFLRKYSLDELPQLFNVLSGSMSMVGPRPPLPEEVACYSPRRAAQAAREAGDDGTVADQRPQRPVLGGIDSTGFALRGKLVPRVGHLHCLEDGWRSHTRYWRLLTLVSYVPGSRRAGLRVAIRNAVKTSVIRASLQPGRAHGRKGSVATHQERLGAAGGVGVDKGRGVVSGNPQES